MQLEPRFLLSCGFPVEDAVASELEPVLMSRVTDIGGLCRGFEVDNDTLGSHQIDDTDQFWEPMLNKVRLHHHFHSLRFLILWYGCFCEVGFQHRPGCQLLFLLLILPVDIHVRLMITPESGE